MGLRELMLPAGEKERERGRAKERERVKEMVKERERVKEMVRAARSGGSVYCLCKSLGIR